MAKKQNQQNQALSWTDIANDPDFQALPVGEREVVKRAYFRDYIAPTPDYVKADHQGRQKMLSSFLGLEGPQAPDAGMGASLTGLGTAYDASFTGAALNAATGRKRDRSYDNIGDNLQGLAQNFTGANPTAGAGEGVLAAGVGSAASLLDPLGRAVDAATLGLGGKVAGQAVGKLAAHAPELAANVAKYIPHLLGGISGAVQGGGYAALDGDPTHALTNAGIGSLITGAIGLHGAPQVGGMFADAMGTARTMADPVGAMAGTVQIPRPLALPMTQGEIRVRTELANQGIMPGSEAFNAHMRGDPGLSLGRTPTFPDAPQAPGAVNVPPGGFRQPTPELANPAIAGYLPETSNINVPPGGFRPQPRADALTGQFGGAPADPAFVARQAQAPLTMEPTPSRAPQRIPIEDVPPTPARPGPVRIPIEEGPTVIKGQPVQPLPALPPGPLEAALRATGRYSDDEIRLVLNSISPQPHNPHQTADTNIRPVGVNDRALYGQNGQRPVQIAGLLPERANINVPPGGFSAQSAPKGSFAEALPPVESAPSVQAQPPGPRPLNRQNYQHHEGRRSTEPAVRRAAGKEREGGLVSSYEGLLDDVSALQEMGHHDMAQMLSGWATGRLQVDPKRIEQLHHMVQAQRYINAYKQTKDPAHLQRAMQHSELAGHPMEHGAPTEGEHPKTEAPAETPAGAPKKLDTVDLLGLQPEGADAVRRVMANAKKNGWEVTEVSQVDDGHIHIRYTGPNGPSRLVLDAHGKFDPQSRTAPDAPGRVLYGGEEAGGNTMQTGAEPAPAAVAHAPETPGDRPASPETSVQVRTEEPKPAPRPEAETPESVQPRTEEPAPHPAEPDATPAEATPEPNAIRGAGAEAPPAAAEPVDVHISPLATHNGQKRATVTGGDRSLIIEAPYGKDQKTVPHWTVREERYTGEGALGKTAKKETTVHGRDLTYKEAEQLARHVLGDTTPEMADAIKYSEGVPLNEAPPAKPYKLGRVIKGQGEYGDWTTDGYIAFKGEPKKGDIDKGATTADNEVPIAPVIPTHGMDTPVKPVAFSRSHGAGVVWFEHGVAVNQSIVHFFEKRFPGAEFIANPSKLGPMLVRQKGETVGLLMPLNTGGVPHGVGEALARFLKDERGEFNLGTTIESIAKLFGHRSALEDPGMLPGIQARPASPLRLTSEAKLARDLPRLEKQVQNLESFIQRAQGMGDERMAAIGREQAAKLRGRMDELYQHASASRAMAEEAMADVAAPREYSGKKYAGSINLDRIENDEQLKGMYEAVTEHYAHQMGYERGGVVSHAETQRLADSLGMTVDQLLKRRKGQAFNHAEATAARDILQTSGNELKHLAGRLADGTNTDEDVLAFTRALELHAQIQQQVMGVATEAGRALSAFRIQARENAARVREIRAKLEGLGGRDRIEELAGLMAGLDNLAELNAVARQFKKPGAMQKVAEYFVNAILSAVPTHMANSLGNASNVVGKVLETSGAAVVGKLTGTANGRVTVGEAKAQMAAIFNTWRESAALAKHAFLTEQGSPEWNGHEAPMHAIGGKVGAFVRIPSRLLLAQDEFFKSLFYRMELSGTAYRQAHHEGVRLGLSGDALDQHIGTRAAELLDPETMSDAMRAQARKAAEEYTFTQNLAGDHALDALGRALSYAKGENPAFTLFVPFVRTPLNIVKFAAKRSVLGVLSPSVQADLKAGGAARDLAIAKMAIGSMFGLGFTMMAQAGLLTGGGVTDPDMKKTLQATGWQPYSLKVGDEFYQFNRLGPLGLVAGMAADMVDIAKKDGAELEKMPLHFMKAFMDNSMNQTFWRGVADVTKAMSDSDRFLDNWAGNLAGAFIPNIVAKGSLFFDHTQREAGSIPDKLLSRTPMAGMLPEKLGPLGDTVSRDMSPLEEFLSPVRRSHAKHDPVLDELVRLGIPMNNSAKKLGLAGEDLELDSKARHDLTKKKGAVTRTFVEKLLAAPGYLALGDEQKKVVLNKVLNDASSYGRKAFVAEHISELAPQWQAARKGRFADALGGH